MRKISIKNIIEFRKKSEKSKKKFATDLKLNLEKTNSDSGGDYWISSLSAISNSYRFNDLKIIKDKIEELEEKLDNTKFKKTKTMYQRNIDILYSYEDFNFKKYQPSKTITFLKKQKTHSILTLKGLQIQVIPHHLFTFKKNDVEEIGAIWFIAKLGGYSKEELGMFSDVLYKYLKANFSNEYILNPKYCMAIDVTNCSDVSYSQIQKEEVPAILSSTIESIKKLI